MKFNLIIKNRGKKGDGRAVIFKVFPTLSYEELLRHWMENVSSFDPEIQDEVDRVRSYHEEIRDEDVLCPKRTHSSFVGTLCSALLYANTPVEEADE